MAILLSPPYQITRLCGGDSSDTPSDSAVLHGRVAAGVSGELRYYVHRGSTRGIDGPRHIVAEVGVTARQGLDQVLGLRARRGYEQLRST